MSQSTLPVTTGTASTQHPIVVEMSTKQLPPRMRLGGLRSAIGLPNPPLRGLRQVLMAPVAMMTRLLSR